MTESRRGKPRIRSEEKAAFEERERKKAEDAVRREEEENRRNRVIDPQKVKDKVRRAFGDRPAEISKPMEYKNGEIDVLVALLVKEETGKKVGAQFTASIYGIDFAEMREYDDPELFGEITGKYRMEGILRVFPNEGMRNGLLEQALQNERYAIEVSEKTDGSFTVRAWSSMHYSRQEIARAAGVQRD